MKLLIILFILTTSQDAFSFTCRDYKVKKAFDKLNGYPQGRKGYIVDHICALSIGGKDTIENMQYQTIVQSRAKDKIETTQLGKEIWCTKENSTPTRQVFNCNK